MNGRCFNHDKVEKNKETGVFTLKNHHWYNIVIL
jgi:hypothetical protein